MCVRNIDAPDGILDVADGHMKAAQARWSRLGPSDLGSVRNKQDLITTVGARYELSHRLAVQDVEAWDLDVRSAGQPVHRSRAQ